MTKLFYTLSTLLVLLLSACTDPGKGQTVTAGTKVTLDATNTRIDLGGKITRYTWSQLEKDGVPMVHLYDKYSAISSFIAPSVSKDTKLTFKVETVESYNCTDSQDSSCSHHKASANVTITVTKSDSNSTSGTTSGRYSVAVAGIVKGTSNQAISGALVRANSNDGSTSNAQGAYSLTNISTSERVVLTASHPDYFDNARVVLAHSSNAFSQNITLVNAGVMRTLQPSEGGTVDNNNASIIFPAGTKFRTSKNKSYSGDVTVKMAYLDAKTSTGKAALPGSYEGKDAASTFPLHTYGFMQVALSDTDGNPLTLSTKSNVTLKFPASTASKNESQISMWELDKTTGYWLETKKPQTDVDTHYTVEINKLETFGIHAPANGATLGICVENQNGTAIAGANVVVSSANWQANLTQTDTNGKVTLSNVIAGENLSIVASKALNQQNVQAKYTSAVSLVAGETRNLATCIELHDSSIADRNSTN